MAATTMKTTRKTFDEEGDQKPREEEERCIKKWLESLVSGALSFRRMVKREDLLKIFFVYLCLLHVSPGHPCGRNPISRFQPLTKMLGRDINSLLNLLRSSNPALYQQVQDEWRRYADCVGLVDTGYFKRSSTGTSKAPQESLQGRGQRGLELPEAFRAANRSRRTQRLLTLMRSLAAAAVAAGDSDGDAKGAAQALRL